MAVLGMSASMVAQQSEQSKPEHAPRYKHVRYTITDLGVLSGLDPSSTAYDMNNVGWVAGGSGNLLPPGPQHAFLWFGKGPLIDLGTLGGPNSEAGGPNLRGEAAIISETALTNANGEDFCGFGDHLQCLAAVWRHWKLTALPTLPGGNNTQAYGLNNAGQVIGFSETGVADPDCATGVPFQVLRYKAVIWEPNGEVRKLRPLHGDTVGFGFGINDKGQAIGGSGLCSNVSLPPNYPPDAPHAVLWERDGSPINLGSLDGAYSNIATSINDRGEVVGNSHFTDGTIHPFLWTKRTGMQGLGVFPGAFVTVAPCCNTLNNKGEVVGFAIDDAGLYAFLWRDNVFTDLNDLLPSDSRWQLQQASSINDAGEIVGVGMIDGESHAFLAVPSDQHHGEHEW
jgi:probable HAF family extracellular repeat protein